MSEIQLSEAEFSILSDRTHFEIRERLNAKINQLLLELKQELSKVHQQTPAGLTGKGWISEAKLSRGENYKGLPYRVLDYPAHFSRAHTFLFRALVLWGHHLSFHLILTGDFITEFGPRLSAGFADLTGSHFHLSQQASPWEWELDATSHLALSALSPEQFHEQVTQGIPLSENDTRFVKLSRSLDLNEYARLPQVGSETLGLLLELLA